MSDHIELQAEALCVMSEGDAREWAEDEKDGRDGRDGI